MTRLAWDETDVLACLGVEPVAEDDFSVHYMVDKGDCVLRLAVIDYSIPTVHCELTRADRGVPLVSFSMEGVAEIRRRCDDSCEELVFVSSHDVELRPTIPYGFVLQVSPVVSIRFGDPGNPVTALFAPG